MIDDSSKDYVLTVARFSAPCNHGKKKLMGWAPNTLIIFESTTEQIKISSGSLEFYMTEMNFDGKSYVF
jgi:hypothetical protein